MTPDKRSVKHIKFSETDYFSPQSNSGGSNKPFKKVDRAFVNGVLESIKSLYYELEEESHFNFGLGTAVLKLEDKATAKTHRPVSLFNEDSCPFIGDLGYNRFAIEVTKEGLDKLYRKVSESFDNNTKAGLKALSTIANISSFNYFPKDDLKNSNALIIRLFRYSSEEKNNFLDSAFESFLNDIRCSWEKFPSERIRIYRVDKNITAFLSSIKGAQTIHSVINSNSIVLEPLSSDVSDEELPDFSMEPGSDYPTVGVVDSGISDDCLPLKPWLRDRQIHVIDQDRDLNHGTFVGGLISGGRKLNGGSNLFPSCQSKIYSVEVLGKAGGDPFEIFSAMKTAATNNRDIKVWNLSLGASEPVSMSEISIFAILLDEFQDEFNCLCIVAAGNYNGVPLRNWPPQDNLFDGISSPGDSVRALTVGSLAHIDGLVKVDEPSPFSRRGPVSNYVQKPEVVHYGGNIQVFGQQPIPLGLASLSPNGNVRRDIGTSFSTPFVSSIAANLHMRLGARATPEMVKALIVHNANINNRNEDYSGYFGWGRPLDSNQILAVESYESTMVFEGDARRSFEVRKLPFPIPECLRTPDGKVRGEFFITLAYSPELDPDRAFEYCQVNLDVGLGKVEGNKFNSKIPLQKGKVYESELTKTGDKWSPIKVYKKAFPQGVDVENWKLRVTLLNREGYEIENVKVPFTLLITIRDIDQTQPVYNEMTRLMDEYNWEVSDLVVDNRLQL